MAPPSALAPTPATSPPDPFTEIEPPAMTPVPPAPRETSSPRSGTDPPLANRVDPTLPEPVQAIVLQDLELKAGRAKDWTGGQ